MQVSESPSSYQSQLARYCRSGRYRELPGVRPEGIRVYRDLILNAVSEVIDAAFPLCEQWMGATLWHRQVRDFLTHHACRSAQYWKVPEEFAAYMEPLLDRRFPSMPPLADLLRMELTEWTLFLAEDAAQHCGSREFRPGMRLGLHPEVRLLLLNYPVHLLPASKITADMKGAYVLIARRNEDQEVQFSECSLLEGTYLDLLREQGPQQPDHSLDQLQELLGATLEPEASGGLFAFMAKALASGLLYSESGSTDGSGL